MEKTNYWELEILNDESECKFCNDEENVVCSDDFDMRMDEYRDLLISHEGTFESSYFIIPINYCPFCGNKVKSYFKGETHE